jgi:hypothetical protein
MGGTPASTSNLDLVWREKGRRWGAAFDQSGSA